MTTQHPEIQASLKQQMHGVMLDFIRTMRKPYQQMTEEEQDTLLSWLEGSVTDVIRQAVHAIASDGRRVIVSNLEKFTVKDGVKVEIKCSNQPQILEDLGEAVGKPVLLVAAGTDEYTYGDVEKPEANQRALPDMGYGS